MSLFSRLVEEKQLIGYPYDGFWASMDTFKDKQQLESLCSGGCCPVGSLENQWQWPKVESGGNGVRLHAFL